MVVGKKWILVNNFQGAPKESDLELRQEELPPLKDNEVIVEALYISVDPYMRYMGARLPKGSTMVGEQVGRISESKNPEYPVGTLVQGFLGWQSHTVVSEISTRVTVSGGVVPLVSKVHSALQDLSPSLVLGALGMPGLTAYYGLLRVCEMKAGETVLVNSAAGAVGHVVGQIAKIKGCTVIGYAGTDEKVKWLTELGFDHAFNYKKCNLGETLKQVAPDGIDCFFDNVGGDFFDTVVTEHMKYLGRVAVCGYISGYNATNPAKPFNVLFPFSSLLSKELRIEGFIVTRFKADNPQSVQELADWYKQGKLKTKEYIIEGIENVPKTFIGMLSGENFGKALVKI